MREKAIVQQNLASCYLSLGQIEKSKGAYNQAIELFEPSNQLEEISRCYFYIGIAEFREKKTQSALENFRLSLECRRKVSSGPNSDTGFIHS